MDHEARRARLATTIQDLGVDALLITRLPNVRYLTGFSGSNAQLVLGAGGAAFLTDGRYDAQSRHEVPDLPRTVYLGQTVGAVAEACRRLGTRRVGFESAGVTFQSFEQLRAAGLDLVPTEGAVERLRQVKDAEELDLLRAAQAIADEGFERITAKLTEGMTERRVAFELDTFLREQTADGVAFDTIVAFGEQAAEPHHHPTDRPLRVGDGVKMDFGCVVGGYHSDMTRTVAFGEPSTELRDVHELVRRAQQAGVDAVRPGATASDVDAASRAVIAEAGLGEAFSHPLGHGTGLEIHEAPWLRAGNEEPLSSGEVVTVEPGVYLPGRLGVRIEDMVEVTADGSRPIPRTPKELIVL